MFTAVSLGIFDRLAEAPADAGRLAAATRTDPGALERLLDGCVALGLLRKSGAQYSNAPVADAWLRRNSDHTLAGYILYSDRTLFPMWSHLEDALREASPRWKQTFGEEAGIFSGFYRSESAMRDFLLGMHGFGLISSPAVVAAFDLSGFRRLVDLGGATGHLAAEARKLYPDLECAVFDLPAVAAVAREFAGDIDYITGDFFTDPLPTADLYAVGRILHDWSDAKALALLQKIRAALPAGGGLLIAEILLDEDKTGPVTGLMQSLNMLVCAEGRERTLSEYMRLLDSAGFHEVEGKRTGAPLDAILAR